MTTTCVFVLFGYLVNNQYKGGIVLLERRGTAAVFDRIVDYLRAFCDAVSLSLCIEEVVLDEMRGCEDGA